MMLNPEKCTFAVASGKFLGFMVNQRGIEANPEKIQAIISMKAPRRGKDIQKLTGCVAALNRFISRSTDKCLPFFNALRGSKTFLWTEECEKAFEDLKTYLGQVPLLAKPIPGEKLFTYLAVSKAAISSVLVKESSGI